MSEKVNGSFYTATIEKSRVVALDGAPLNFKVDIYCEEEILFKELIDVKENNKEDIIKPTKTNQPSSKNGLIIALSILASS